MDLVRASPWYTWQEMITGVDEENGHEPPERWAEIRVDPNMSLETRLGLVGTSSSFRCRIPHPRTCRVGRTISHVES